MEHSVSSTFFFFQVYNILKINQDGLINEKDDIILRSAFVIATGHVFSDLKYMHMPKYLSSENYRVLLQSQVRLVLF